MWVIRRVTVDLPLVPGDRDDRHRAGPRRGSRTAGWRRPRRSAPPSARPGAAWVPVRRTRRAGETDRPARSTAASAISRARSAPDHGQVTTQRPASDARWTTARTRVLAVVGAQAAGPGDEIRHGVRPLADRDRRGRGGPAEPSCGRPGSVPGARPADGDLDLDHRQQPVDVGALEQPDLDESHGPDNSTRRSRAATARSGAAWRRVRADRLGAWPAPTTPSSHPKSSPRCGRASSAPTRPTSPTSSGS